MWSPFTQEGFQNTPTRSLLRLRNGQSISAMCCEQTQLVKTKIWKQPLQSDSPKDRAGLDPLSRQWANISLAVMHVYTYIMYMFIYMHRDIFNKVAWTLFLGQQTAAEEKAQALAAIQPCTFSASGMLTRPALLKWAPYHAAVPAPWKGSQRALNVALFVALFVKRWKASWNTC